ncbi:MAG: hypothetical protein NDJ89_07685 [Oligoflexia bacterium]|nr:hypothetical protein [Oligoflexia bacterium]
MKNSFLLLSSLLVLALASSAQAASTVSYAIEPIIGYDRVQKLAPTAHVKNRLIYGARARAGIPLVSLEAEFTRGQDTESYPEQDLSILDRDDKLKLGIVSSYRLSTLVRFNLRLGGQAKRSHHEETQAGVTTVTDTGPTYRPYAGVGLSSRLGRNFDLSGGVTVVFNDFPRMAANEYQTTLGFNVSFP